MRTLLGAACNFTFSDFDTLTEVLGQLEGGSPIVTFRGINSYASIPAKVIVSVTAKGKKLWEKRH